MEIDERLKGNYEGNIKCDLCKRELKENETIDVIQMGMFVEEEADESTYIQYGDDQEQTVLCKDCSPKVKVVVVD